MKLHTVYPTNIILNTLYSPCIIQPYNFAFRFAHLVLSPFFLFIVLSITVSCHFLLLSLFLFFISLFSFIQLIFVQSARKICLLCAGTQYSSWWNSTKYTFCNDMVIVMISLGFWVSSFCITDKMRQLMILTLMLTQCPQLLPKHTVILSFTKLNQLLCWHTCVSWIFARILDNLKMTFTIYWWTFL